MGKNKKKDPEKKAALQAKKEAKQNKAAQKRLQKEAKDDTADRKSGSSSIVDKHQSLDDLLEAYRHKDVSGSKPIVETLKGYPPARGNFTFTLCDGEQKGKQDFYLFGGEYYDGIEMVVVDQLLRWDKNSEWRQIISPSAAPAPPPRCAHTTVYYNGSLYVFGGELASAENYHHYKDLWKYDIKQQTWTELISRTGSVPSPRSGHSAIVWKSYMILFGGFFEAAKNDNPRWFNDVYVFNLQTEQWMEVPYSKLGSRPEPRSACNTALVGDSVIIHGGYSKLVNSAAAGGAESKVHTDAWILNLKPLLQDKPPTWERLLSSSGGRGGAAGAINSRNPNGRSGCASCTYKDRMLVFGGVVDSELMHHKMDSIFYNDLFALDVEKRKWFPIKARKGKSKQQTQQTDPNESSKVRPSDENTASEADEGKSNDDDEDDQFGEDDLSEPEEDGGQKGWDLDKLRANMFAFYDAHGNLVYEKIEEETTKAAGQKKGNDDADTSEDEKEEEKEDSSDSEVEEEKEEEKESNDDEPVEKNSPPSKTAQQKKPPSSNPPSSVKIASSSVMKLNSSTKVPEAVQREEPLPRMNAVLVTKGNTLYLYGGLVEIGDREVTLDDMWSFDLKKCDQWNCMYPGTMHKQVWRGAVHDDDDSYISTGAGEEDDDDDSDSDEEDDAAQNKTKLKKLAAVKEEISELNAKYDLHDEHRTPEHGEALADFYSRTRSYWNEQAIEKLKKNENYEEPSKKELKREGFLLAEERFNELESVMKRLEELGPIGEQSSTTKKREKKDKKKSKDRSKE